MRRRSSLLFFGFLICLTVAPCLDGAPVKHGKSNSRKLVKKATVQTSVKDVSVEKKSLLQPGQSLAKEKLEDAKKKGTIRLSGPWHSDSGLDRNIDPQEDSYVKKVIASNEGLNFNKDMAEAGEVFDVNGIEDFYDKSALITYEVNGHEIPVHMKPKLTPQNQPMFPEYGHEPGPAIPESRSNNMPTRNNPLHKATTFYGMSLKDMPEYKVMDTPSVGDKPHQTQAFSGRQSMNDPRLGEGNSFTSRHRLEGDPQSAYQGPSMLQSHRQTAPLADSQSDKTAAEYAQANSIGQEDAQMAHRMQSFYQAQNRNPEFNQLHREAPDASLTAFNQKSDGHQYPESHQYFANNRPAENFAASDGKYQHQAAEPEEAHMAEPVHSAHQLFDRPGNGPTNIEEFQHALKQMHGAFDGVDQYKARPGLKEFYNKPTASFESAHKPSEDSALTGQSRDVGKEFDGGKLAPAEAVSKEHRKEGGGMKEDDSNSFFEQLEKMDEQKRKSEKHDEADGKDESPDADNGSHKSGSKTEKVKAKEKLLKILGDLTSKLKGMEAAVKDAHTDERRESSSMFPEPPENQKSPNQQQFEEENKLRRQDSRDAEQEHTSEPEPAMDHATDNDNHASDIHSAAKSRDTKEESEAPLQSPQLVEPHYASNSHVNYNAEHGEEERPEDMTHLINKYNQHQKPFIFNTDSIDYKAPHDTRENKDDFEENSGKDHVHHALHKSPASHRLYERPIISAFYHGSEAAPGGYPDLDDARSHSESNPSDSRQVTPTQRDGGGKDAAASKDEESFDADNAKSKDKDDDKSGKSRDADNKPEIDEDLPDYNEVKDAAVFEENLIRKKYHADSLRWSDDLSDDAQKEADDLAGEKNLDLSKTKVPKAENIALLPLESLNVGKDSADAWQKESAKFDFMSPLVTTKNSDFAQMVWKSAKEFGLGVAKTRDRSNWIVVAKYDTPIVSEYEKLKANIESDIPVPDPYSDIARR